MAAQQDGGLLGFVVVALHQAGAGDAQLAPLADGQLLIGTRLKAATTVFTMGMPTLPGLLSSPAATVAAEDTSVMP